MVDRHFSDPELAELYDVLHPWEPRGDLAFYLPVVLAADAVLDVGCGTGALLHRAREAGHTGRLCGLDPADGMLRVARRRSDIEWVLGDLASIAWEERFDLVVMTGHAFQVFLDDDELRASLAAIRSALRPGGHLAFETRNPSAREWERWTPDRAVELEDDAGAVGIRMEHCVDGPMVGDIVAFTTTYTSATWDQPRVSRSTLRFIDRDPLATLLSEARFTIEAQYGDWTADPVTATSPEIITIARRA